LDEAGAFVEWRNNVAPVLKLYFRILDPLHLKPNKLARGCRDSSLDIMGHMCFKVLLTVPASFSIILNVSFKYNVRVFGPLLLKIGNRKFARGYRASPFIMEQKFAHRAGVAWLVLAY